MKLDPYLFALVGTVLFASLLPASGEWASVLRWAVQAAVAGLFFLYGARLSASQIFLALRRYPPQLLVFLTTYLVFPLLGLLLAWSASGWLDQRLTTGLLFLTLLPSTVQSSIAFTSIAGGNVATALCSASVSNLAGVVLTPLLTSWFIGAGDGQAANDSAIRDIALQILVPFLLGQAFRPALGARIERNKRLVGFFDRGSILLVVYSAFSAGMLAGVWQAVSVRELLFVLVVSSILLALVLAFTFSFSRALHFDRAEEIAIVFCGSKKSMASGIPMANVLFSASSVGAIVIPLMLFHQLQLFVCAIIAQKYARSAQGKQPAT